MSETRAELEDRNTFMDDQSGVDVVPSFSDMPLPPNLLRGIYASGFQEPSPIQQRAIVPFIQGKDIIAQAHPGTGKTGAFSIGLLARLDFNQKNLQALVLCPTRELASQTDEEISRMGGYLAEQHVFSRVLVGGIQDDIRSIQDDIRNLQADIIVAVGTPGNVFNHISSGALRPDTLRCIVLDDADEMLSKGFGNQIHELFKFVPKDIQVAVFSTIMSQDVLDMSTRLMRRSVPTQILVKGEPITFEGIKQFYVAVEEENKLDTLMDFHDSVAIAQSFVFANTRRKVDHIAETLNKNNFAVTSLHFEMTSDERDKAIATFRSGNSRVLVTDDSLGHGINFWHAHIAVNYDLPTNKDNYARRAANIGRNKRKDVVISFVSGRDVERLREIEAHFHTEIKELPMDFVTELDKN